MNGGVGGGGHGGGHAGHGDGSGGGMPGGDDNNSMPAMCPMMVLNACVTEEFVVIFKQWKVNSVGSFLLTILLVFGLGVLYEALQWARWQMDKRESERQERLARWLHVRQAHQSDPDLLSASASPRQAYQDPYLSLTAASSTGGNGGGENAASPSPSSPLLPQLGYAATSHHQQQHQQQGSPIHPLYPYGQGRSHGASTTTTRTHDTSSTTVFFDDVAPPLSRDALRSTSTRHRHLLARCSLHGLHSLYGMFVMLIAMTYNIWLLLALALGASVGYALFAKDRQGHVAAAMSCH